MHYNKTIMKRIFSGIQPSGLMHIGNYLGAIQNWVELQDKYESLFCIVDLHAITVPQDPKELKKNIVELAKIYIASGIDPKKSTMFVQSDRPEHSELAWILNCFTSEGELRRMTQYKTKTNQDAIENEFKKIVQKTDFKTLKDPSESIRILHDTYLEVREENEMKHSVSLFDYPALMAADILLYQTDLVPVGEDQKQHVEFTRDIANRMNNKFGKLFRVPEVEIKKEGARIMGLDDPSKKMSKSATSAYNWISIREEPEDIRKKIQKAVTDEKGIDNLAVIHSSFSGKSTVDIKKEFAGRNADFKKELAEVIIEGLKPIQGKLAELDKNPDVIEKVLKEGAEKVRPIAEKTISEVKNRIGLG